MFSLKENFSIQIIVNTNRMRNNIHRLINHHGSSMIAVSCKIVDHSLVTNIKRKRNEKRKKTKENLTEKSSSNCRL